MCIGLSLWRTTTTLSGLFHKREHFPLFFSFTCKLAALKKTTSLHNVKDNTLWKQQIVTASENKATHFLIPKFHLQIIRPTGHTRE